MKNLKKFLALGLAVTMTMSMAACGNTTTTDGTGSEGTGTTGSNTGSSSSSDGDTRIIDMGCWWIQHYDSADETLDVAEDYVNAQPADGDDEATAAQKEINRQICELKFNKVAEIEQEYNVELYWRNLTYAGVQESINTSILAGSPDCEIYMVECSMAIPAQMNGLAIDLKTILPEDSDLFTEQKIISYLDLGDGKACILKKVEASDLAADSYPLGFNMQLLEENNLEDPRDLWERGEWTWDKFNEYLTVLTQDTDGDGQIDQYGYCGYEQETFAEIMMSNGASIATGKTETLSSAATGEALQQIYDMYNVMNVCYPYDYDGEPSETMRSMYTNGNIAFFPIAAWINAKADDYDWDNTGDEVLPFDIAYVRWPVGPSGDKETNAGKNAVNGTYYIIPAGVENPELVYNVLYELWDWGNGDVSLRDNKAALKWWYTVTAKTEELQNANFEVMCDAGSHSTADLWNTMGISYDIQSLLKGETTPAQFQETYKQQVQDGLDVYFN